MLHQENPSGSMEKDEDERLKTRKKRGVIAFVILLAPRLDKGRQGKDMENGKLEGDRTVDEQGGREMMQSGGRSRYTVTQILLLVTQGELLQPGCCLLQDQTKG